MSKKINKRLICFSNLHLLMKSEVVKPTKRNKCDLCDELATFKLKKDDEPTSYLCNICYKESINETKH